MKNLRLFQELEDYTEVANTLKYPTVSHIINADNSVTKNVKYTKLITAKHKCLTLEAIDDCDFVISIGGNNFSSLSYSLDDGETWTTYGNQDDGEDSTVRGNRSNNDITIPTVEAGNKVMLQGTNPFNSDNDNVHVQIECNNRFNASGNPLSVYFRNGFADVRSLVPGCFFGMFRDSGIVSAANLILSSPKKLAEGCYASMFAGCGNLTTPPALPSKNLAESCYQEMFKNCISLASIPDLPATIMADSCYAAMFEGCTSLTTVPMLSGITMAEGCYSSMFQNCTSIEEVGPLIAPNLAAQCYEGMFWGCTSLEVAPALPAATLAEGCYANMFYGCTSLTTGPVPIQSLLSSDSGGYIGVDPGGSVERGNTKGNNSLPTSILPADELADYCYQGMFQGCSSLIYPPQLPATIMAYGCYDNMFYGCTSLTTAPSLQADTLAQHCYGAMFNGCTSLTTAPSLPASVMETACYWAMFNGCTSLITPPTLPSKTLANGCYQNMFSGCTSLITAPELPATTLATSCYYLMFSGCTSLTTAPKLSASTLVSNCYKEMFKGCTNLNYVKALFTTTPSDSYTQNWLQNVAGTGTFEKSVDAQWNVTGTNGIPSGWTTNTYPTQLTPNYNSKEYVDLDLPSGTMWGKHNAGTSSETGYGYHYSWGGTSDYSTSTSTRMAWDNYVYGTSSSNITKYNYIDNKKYLELSDDAANVNKGGDWHMPTKGQLDELIANTNHEWISSGTKGIKFISKTDSTRYIFIPAAGCNNVGIINVGSAVRLWTNTKSGDAYGYRLSADESELKVHAQSKYQGCSARGVIDTLGYDNDDPIFGVSNYTFTAAQYNYEYEYEDIIYALTHPNQPGIIIIDDDENDPIKSGDSR